MQTLAIVNDEEITARLTLADSLRREGRYAEARAVLSEEIAALAPDDVSGKLLCAIARSKVERSAERYDVALYILSEASPLENSCDSSELRAKYRHALAYTLQLQGKTDPALVEYAMASKHWADAEKLYDAGCTENNVALIQLSLKRLEDSREHVTRARKYFVDMPVKSAEVDETEAQLLLAEGKSFEALRMVNRAVEVFFAYGETELVRKAMPTLIKASVDYQCASSR